PAGMPYPHPQRFYDQQGQQQGQQLLVQGEKLRADQMNDAVRGPDKTEVNIGSGTDTTTSGGAQSVGIMRFLPGRLEIKVNETVVWTTADRFTPHTVTFGKEPDDPTAVVGVSGGRAVIASPGQAVSSGFLRA